MSRALIELTEVEAVFDADNGNGRTVALSGVSLEVGAGELICILGPSGCGKTTLLNLIAGFLPPAAGSVCVAGEPVRAPGPDRAAVFQDAALFPWLTVSGNIDFVMKVSGRRRGRDAEIEDLLSLVGLLGFAGSYPHELSGGMKQRVAIARALALQPRALLLDEPFGALDAQTRERLQDEILRIWEQTGTTIVFVTHNVEEAAYLGERVIVLSERPGRVLYEEEVDLPRPRSRLAEGVCDLKRRLFETLPHSIGSGADGPCCSGPEED